MYHRVRAVGVCVILKPNMCAMAHNHHVCLLRHPKTTRQTSACPTLFAVDIESATAILTAKYNACNCKPDGSLCRGVNQAINGKINSS